MQDVFGPPHGSGPRLVAILLRQLKRSAIEVAVNCRPTGLPPAAPLLSALAYHVSPCFNLLYSIFYVFFWPSRLFLPVTDSDKLTKAHETKKRRSLGDTPQGAGAHM